LKLRYRARFLLIGSMNPEEGRLRPQLMDRFGLRALVRGLDDTELRFQAYEAAMAYKRDPDALAAAYAEGTLALAEEIQAAIALLPQVEIGDAARQLGLNLVARIEIDSNRAEITLFEAARTHAAADARTLVEPADIEAVAMMALRQRQSPSLKKFFDEQAAEDEQMRALFAEHFDT
jgi:magnesium chelatase subunit I